MLFSRRHNTMYADALQVVGHFFKSEGRKAGVFTGNNQATCLVLDRNGNAWLFRFAFYGTVKGVFQNVRNDGYSFH